MDKLLRSNTPASGRIILRECMSDDNLSRDAWFSCCRTLDSLIKQEHFEADQLMLIAELLVLLRKRTCDEISSGFENCSPYIFTFGRVIARLAPLFQLGR